MNYELTGRAGLLEILSWARPHDSATDRAFCREYLDRIPGMRSDAFGNRMITIGGRPRTLWSCHVDTVAAVGGAQAEGIDAHGVEIGRASWRARECKNVKISVVVGSLQKKTN